MFLTSRPSNREIDRFLDQCRALPLSYAPVGLVRERPTAGRFDEAVTAIGSGRDDFDRALSTLVAWKHFRIGWVEAFPRPALTEPDTVVAVLIRHFGFWSLNGARVVYTVGDAGREERFGFAYGTLTNHAESGEELFEVFLDGDTGRVMYRIRAVSWPQAIITRVGQPIVRVLQARFRRDSAAAMKRATVAGRCAS
jgi:uncharacterized protein (UPF0548 family)